MAESKGGFELRCILATDPEISPDDLDAALEAARNPLSKSAKRTYSHHTRWSIAALEKAGWQRPKTAEPEAKCEEPKGNTPESPSFQLRCILAADPEISSADLDAKMEAARMRLKKKSVQDARYDIRETIKALEKTSWRGPETAVPRAAESEEAAETGGRLKEVGAFEAKNRLGQLLDLVERGEEVVITRHGREVARLVPPKGSINRAEARAAAQRIREMRKGVTLGGLSLKDLINEGRL
jgi:prevent-host-death family protein